MQDSADWEAAVEVWAAEGQAAAGWEAASLAGLAVEGRAAAGWAVEGGEATVVAPKQYRAAPAPGSELRSCSCRCRRRSRRWPARVSSRWG